MTRLISWLLPFLLLLATSFAMAQSEVSKLRTGDSVSFQPKVASKVGDFRAVELLNNSTIGCNLGAGSNAAETSYLSCLRLGALGLQKNETDIRSFLKQIHEKLVAQMLTQGRIDNPADPVVIALRLNLQAINSPIVHSTKADGEKTLVFPVSSPVDLNANRTTGMYNYLVAALGADGKVKSLQITGGQNAVSNQIDFSGITLGTKLQFVQEALGNPTSVAEVPQIKGKRWNYDPFPFSIEFQNDQVYSIRVEMPTPDSLGRSFAPLKSIPQ